MVKVTIVGRARDGLPLAQGLMYMNEDNGYLSYYRQQAEFILQEISRGALVASKMTILIDHYCFNYLVENGVVFIVSCVSTYPRKLAFHYLQDIQKEFEKFDKTLIDKITRPYSFVKFGGIIANITRHYIDTRTQANLSKLNANRKQDLDIVTEDMFSIVERRRHSETMERLQVTPQPASSIWCSPRLEGVSIQGFLSEKECDHLINMARDKLQKSMVADNESGKNIMSQVRTSSGIFFTKAQIVIALSLAREFVYYLESENSQVIALKWTPIMIIVITSMALLWATIVLSDDFIISSW